MSRLLQKLKFEVYKRPRRVKFSLIFVSSLLIFLTFLLIFLSSRLPPMARELGKTEIQKALYESMNEAVKRYCDENDEQSLYTVEKGSDGSVTAVTLNTYKANELKSILTEYTIDEVDKKSTALYIPTGNALGGTIISGLGRKIKINILSVSSVHGDIIDDFTEAGLNQTLHTVKIRLKTTAKAQISGKIFDVECDSDVLLSKTLIVGKIPSHYTNVSRFDKETLNWLNSYKG